MSKPEKSSQNIRKITIKPGKSPLPVALVIKKDRSITIRSDEASKLMENFKLIPQTLKTAFYKEDIIYESKPDDFLKGNPLEKVVIVNILDRLANASRTVARFYSITTNEIIQELTSDNLVKLIGQSNYDTVFSALCSVINQESKIRGILSLLTPQEDSREPLCKPEINEPPKCYEEKCSQTDENCIDLLLKYKDAKKRRIRRMPKQSPYVVTDDLVKPQKRLVIHPNQEMHRQIKIESQNSSNLVPIVSGNIIKLAAVNDETVEQNSLMPFTDALPLPEIKSLNLSEDSNCSIGNLSVLSNYSAENLLELKNPNELLKNVDRYTNADNQIKIATIKSEADTMECSVNRENWPKIMLPDGSEIKVPVKPEDNFHIATPEILKRVQNNERVKLLWYQAYVDWKYCLDKDADGYMPIHVAVINDDVDMLRRQCLVLRSRHQSLDVIASDLTPLQMALLQDTPHCGALAGTLLQHGADPLLADSERRSPAHMAAEAPFEALQALIAHCQKAARAILEDHEELWKTEYSAMTDEELSKILLDRVCNAFDGQGYTPLMVASRHGLHRSVQLFLDACPASVNTQTPNAGDTALYIAVGASCMHAIDRGNKSKVPDNYKATITALVAAGADAFLQNLSGSNVNDLLSENNIHELNLLIGNKITSMKFFDGNMPEDTNNYAAYMLEDNKGVLSITEIGDKRRAKRNKVTVVKAGDVNIFNINANETLISDKNADNKVPGKTAGYTEIKKNKVTVVSAGDVKNRNIKVNQTLISDENADNKVCGETASYTEVKTKEKPIILENIEIPLPSLLIDGTKPINSVFISNSNVKFINPQDKLQKISSNATTSTVTNISSTSSNVATQNISQLDVKGKTSNVATQNISQLDVKGKTSNVATQNISQLDVKGKTSNVATQNISQLDVKGKTVIKRRKKEIFIVNFNDRSVEDETKQNTKVTIVNAINTVIKRKTTEDGPSGKKQKVVIIHPSDAKNI